MEASADLYLEAFLAANPETHSIFQPTLIPGGGLSLFQPDWMHCKHLGTDSTLLGSVLAFLCKEVLPDSAEANMAIVWEHVQTFYKNNRTKNRLGRLTYNMVKHEPFPRLSAKAVETRDLLPAVASYLALWPGNALCTWFRRLTLLSIRMDQIVFGNPTYMLSMEERVALREAIFDYSQTLTRLCHFFHERGMPYCNFTIKNHYMCHIGLDTAKSGVSPRLAFLFPRRRPDVCD